ncbi:hypothetical protein cypCar_00046944, partial [Cyprinus carpio]
MEPVYEVKIKLEFRSKDSFTDDLNDRQSPAFKIRATLVQDILTLLFKKFDSFLRVTVLLFRKGSVITTSELAFNSTQNVPSELQIAEKLLSDNKTLYDLNITSFSVNNTEYLSTTTTPAATSTTTEPSTIITTATETFTTSAAETSTTKETSTIMTAAETSTTSATETFTTKETSTITPPSIETSTIMTPA